MLILALQIMIVWTHNLLEDVFIVLHTLKHRSSNWSHDYAECIFNAVGSLETRWSFRHTYTSLLVKLPSIHIEQLVTLFLLEYIAEYLSIIAESLFIPLNGSEHFLNFLLIRWRNPRCILLHVLDSVVEGGNYHSLIEVALTHSVNLLQIDHKFDRCFCLVKQLSPRCVVPFFTVVQIRQSLWIRS